MRLLLLLPNFILIMISGYNLSNDFAATGKTPYITITMLHVLVMGLCLVFSFLIVKSMFRIAYVADDVSENETQVPARVQHSI